MDTLTERYIVAPFQHREGGTVYRRWLGTEEGFATRIVAYRPEEPVKDTQASDEIPNATTQASQPVTFRPSQPISTNVTIDHSSSKTLSCSSKKRTADTTIDEVTEDGTTSVSNTRLLRKRPRGIAGKEVLDKERARKTIKRARFTNDLPEGSANEPEQRDPTPPMNPVHDPLDTATNAQAQVVTQPPSNLPTTHVSIEVSPRSARIQEIHERIHALNARELAITEYEEEHEERKNAGRRT
ncbi:MAG: hypothetical protein Q9218_004638 [Villophora microphyllina]